MFGELEAKEDDTDREPFLLRFFFLRLEEVLVLVVVDCDAFGEGDWADDISSVTASTAATRAASRELAEVAVVDRCRDDVGGGGGRDT